MVLAGHSVGDFRPVPPEIELGGVAAHVAAAAGGFPGLGRAAARPCRNRRSRFHARGVFRVGTPTPSFLAGVGAHRDAPPKTVVT